MISTCRRDTNRARTGTSHSNADPTLRAVQFPQSARIDFSSHNRGPSFRWTLPWPFPPGCLSNQKT